MDISKDERELYDRQIRLWGLEGQARLRNARVLVLGMGAVAVEAAKNLVLAGIGSLTLQCSTALTEDDLAYNFFTTAEHLGSNAAEAAAPRVQRLNARVAVTVAKEPLEDLSDDFLFEHDIVIATQISSKSDLLRVSSITRKAGHAFYAALLSGWAGILFVDLGAKPHEFSVETEMLNSSTKPGRVSVTQEILGIRPPPKGTTTTKLTIRESYTSLADALDVGAQFGQSLRPRQRAKVSPYLAALLAYIDNDEAPEISTRAASLGLPAPSSEFEEEFKKGVGLQISAVAAVIGGLLAQDVINVLTLREYPIQNTVIYDALRGVSRVLYLGPSSPERSPPE